MNRELVTFFRVVRGGKGDQGVAVTVLGPEGEVFSVPKPVLGSPSKEQSLVVLSIVSDLVNQSTSKESYPTPGVVEFRSIN